MTTETDHETQLLCRRCNKPFECHVHAIALCQCNSVNINPLTLEFLSKTNWGCLCVDCLKEIDGKVISLQGKEFPKPAELQDGVHYYKENGLWVFTEYYHMLRGHCCKSGCRHCPYGFKKEKL